MTDEQTPRYFPIPDSEDELLAQCRVDTFRAGGKGGQHQNSTDSGVRLTHLPTGIVIVGREERSQHRNRALVLRRLRRRLEKRNERPPPRKATRVPRSQKRKRLEAKRAHAERKKMRRKPGRHDPE